MWKKNIGVKTMEIFSTRLPKEMIAFIKMAAVKQGKKMQDYVLEIFKKEQEKSK